MISLREILEEAAEQINTFKYPDITDAQGRLNELLTAGGLGTTGDDDIHFLSIGGGRVDIRTTYSVRSCTQHDYFQFPEWIVDDPDPIKAITQWGHEKALRKLKDKVASTKYAYEYAVEELAKKEASLAKGGEDEA